MVVFLLISTYISINCILCITTGVPDTQSDEITCTKHGVGIQEYVGTVNDDTEQSRMLGLSICGQEYFVGNQMNESLILHSVF